MYDFVTVCLANIILFLHMLGKPDIVFSMPIVTCIIVIQNYFFSVDPPPQSKEPYMYLYGQVHVYSSVQLVKKFLQVCYSCIDSRMLIVNFHEYRFFCLLLD